MAAHRKDALQGRWVHSHEEDTDEEMVFRPATHPLPPARGRTSFELRADGSYLERSPGPADVPEESGGSWSLEDDHLVLEAEGDRPGHDWKVTGVEPDRLTVERPD